MLHDLSHYAPPPVAEEIKLKQKDISTLRYKPQRLWDWEKIAMEEAEKAAR